MGVILGGKIERVKAGSSLNSLVLSTWVAMRKEGQWGAGEVFRRGQLQGEAARVLRIWGRGRAILNLYTQ